MTIALPSGARVWLASGHTDMRKGFDGLALLVQEALNAFPVTDLRAMSDMIGLRCRFGDETSPREANRQIGSRFHHGTLC